MRAPCRRRSTHRSPGSARGRLRRAVRTVAIRGRAAITELLVLDDTMRSAFVQGASLDALRTMVRARGVPSLQHDGWRAVRDGRTTMAEVTRVVSEDDGR